MRTTPAGRRIAPLAAALMAFAFGGEALAATYSGSLGSPALYYELDESPGATTALNTGSLTNKDGTYQNGVRLGREAAIACERRASWKDSGGVNAAYLSSGCASQGDNPGTSAFFAGGPNNPQVAVSSVPEYQNYTLEAWVKPDASLADGGIVALDGVGSVYLDDGKVKFVAKATGAAVTVTSASAIAGGVWHYVKASWDNTTGPATGTATLVVASNPSGTPTTATASDTGLPNTSYSSQPSFRIGWTNDGNGALKGHIDNVAYYASAAVASHFSNGDFESTQTGDRVTFLSPEPGAAFNSDPSTPKKPALTYACSVACTANVTGPSTNVNLASGADLPITNPGSYVVTVTAGTYVATSTYTVTNFAGVITNDTPLGWWRFNEDDGIAIADDSAAGSLYDGYYQNASSNGGIGISDAFNDARLFKAGDSGYVGINNVPAQTEGYTVELFFKPSESADMALFDHGATGGGPALYLVGTTVRYRTVDGTVLSGAFDWTKWTHVAATWDGVVARLYVNGVQVDAKQTATGPSGTTAFYLGWANVCLTTPAFRGLMDEASYYGKALSADRILAHFLADPPPPAAAAAAPSAAAPAAAAPAAAAPLAVESRAKVTRMPAAEAKAKAKARAKAKAKARAKALAKARAKAKAKRRAQARRR